MSTTVVGGVAVIELLKKIAHSAGESIPRVTHWQFRDFWLKALGVSLQKNIAQTIIESVDSISRDERGFPLTQYITNGRISRAR